MLNPLGNVVGQRVHVNMTRFVTCFNGDIQKERVFYSVGSVVMLEYFLAEKSRISAYGSTPFHFYALMQLKKGHCDVKRSWKRS